MNCANHPDIAPVAYCRTCGKPLCANCTRDVKGVIYCENCLADRLQGVQPAAVPPAAGFVSAPRQSSRVPGRIPQWRAFSPVSFPSAWARSTAVSTPRGWRTW